MLLLANIFIWHVIAGETRNGLLSVSFLDVGNGSAVLIEGPNGIQVLVDGNGGKNVLTELGKLMPFYDRSLDVVIVIKSDKQESKILSRYEVLLPIMPVGKENVSQRVQLGNGATLTIESATPFLAKLTYGKTSLELSGNYPIEIDKKFYNPNFAGTVTVRMDGIGGTNDENDKNELLVLVESRDKTNMLDNTKLEALLANVAESVLDERSKSANCHVLGPLPDPECTPGAIFPNATIAEICVSGYSKRVRNVSTSLKKRVYAQYGIQYPQKTGTYETDHLIPLAIGGNNDIANLFPEAAEPKPGFKEKDVVEVFLQQEVCAGRADLATAQKQIATDWLAVYEVLTPEQISAIRTKYSNWSN